MILIFVCALLCASVASQSFTVHEISHYGFEKLENFKLSLNGNWIEIGDKLLAIPSFNSPIFIAHGVHESELAELREYILLHHLGIAVVRAQEELIYAALKRADPGRPRKLVAHTGGNLVLATQVENSRKQPMPIMSAPISTLVNSVNVDRWFDAVTTLASYNRYTKGSQIALAQKWIIDQLQTLTNLTVTTQPFTSGSTSGVNVIATIQGSVTPNTWVIVGGHYDSTSQSPNTAAPGAEDDASGAAAVLEMARIFNEYPPPSTLLLIFFSGEEQGLLGSAAHAQSLVNSGDASKVKLMHNMDMIAYQKNPSGTNQVIIETTSQFASLFPVYRQSAASFTTLGLFESTTAWGSDHESYIRRGMPGLLTIDKDWDIYPSYHRTTDTPDKLNKALGEQIIRLGVGAVASMLEYSS